TIGDFRLRIDVVLVVVVVDKLAQFFDSLLHAGHGVIPGGSTLFQRAPRCCRGVQFPSCVLGPTIGIVRHERRSGKSMMTAAAIPRSLRPDSPVVYGAPSSNGDSGRGPYS